MYGLNRDMHLSIVLKICFSLRSNLLHRLFLSSDLIVPFLLGFSLSLTFQYKYVSVTVFLYVNMGVCVINSSVQLFYWPVDFHNFQYEISHRIPSKTRLHTRIIFKSFGVHLLSLFHLRTN